MSLLASPEEYISLDLYADLANIPKNVDVAHNPMTRATQRDNAKEEAKRRTRAAIESPNATDKGTRISKKPRGEDSMPESDIKMDIL